MRSTSCRDLAEETLRQCIAGRPPKELPRALAQDACGQALFSILVEGLADRFDPALVDAYARLFPQAIAHVRPGTFADSLVARYERVRKIRPIAGRPHRIFILSRVTLGADVAVTSVMFAAAKRRFPHAELVFVGPKKNYELLAGDSRIHHAPIEYRRGSLRERLAVWDDLCRVLEDQQSAVIDPDSRLTQLGLLPVCAEDHYHLFESRKYGADSARSLPELASDWAAETFGVAGAKPYVALGRMPQREPYIAVNLGVGENPAKRLPDPFEEELLRLLAATGLPLVVDKGGGPEEGARVMGAVERSGAAASLWEGSFAGFAAIIAGSRLYVGYDSAGQHVAAACGIPLISVFAGFPVPRMFDRWRPSGEQCRVIRVERPQVEATLAQVREAVRDVMPAGSRQSVSAPQSGGTA
ncbi:MAG TPA: glycosyltransferase family 9 protein [Bryobacteraceae bacterium]|nr:glycosyltransferase family 9 protein [Bryobacteraceae bacterium]